MAKWMKANGDVIDVTPKNDGKQFTLDELKEFVGGFIEYVYLPNCKQVIIVNEDGKLMNLPYNTVATEVMALAFQPNSVNDFIVGDALLCEIGTEIE